MTVEENIFKRSDLDIEKLLAYGFKKENGKFLYSTNILDDNFRVDIKIDTVGKVKAKIIELAFNEEYNNFRIEGITGEFVETVRKELETILIDIRNHCFIKKYFISEQANRITDFILKTYHDYPEFVWKKSPGFGVFRNPNNQKWYGLIMNIEKNKIDKGNEEIEIINVKLDSNKIPQLLLKKGFYKAYHMNKKNWISILLDDTLTDKEIINCIIESHKFTESSDEWIIPANPKYYDIANCFNNTDTIIWKQSNHIKIGDIVYLYVTNPYSAILYKCKVLKVDIPYGYKDKNVSMSKVMRIKLLQKYNKDRYTFKLLNKYGITAIRGPRRMPEKLSKYIK